MRKKPVKPGLNRKAVFMGFKDIFKKSKGPADDAAAASDYLNGVAKKLPKMLKDKDKHAKTVKRILPGGEEYKVQEMTFSDSKLNALTAYEIKCTEGYRALCAVCAQANVNIGVSDSQQGRAIFIRPEQPYSAASLPAAPAQPKKQPPPPTHKGGFDL